MSKYVFFLIILMYLSGCQLASSKPNLPSHPSEVVDVQQLPDYLGFVEPTPGGTFSLSEYDMIPSNMGWEWGATTRGAICFGIDPFTLMEPGDMFTGSEKWLPRLKVSADGKRLIKPQFHMETGAFGSRKVDQETGETIWKEPDGSPYGLCYAVKLEPGYHVGSISVEKTSGT